MNTSSTCTIALASILSLALAASPALADGGKGGPGDGPGTGMGRIFHALKAFADELDLSASQKAGIKEKVEAHRADVAPLHEKAEALRQEMIQLLAAKKLSKTKIKAKQAEIQAVHQEIAGKKLDTVIEVLEILDASQREKLFGMIEKWKAEHKGKGKGKGKSW
jgi:Spy/CpxP family protein refolding chaperone